MEMQYDYDEISELFDPDQVDEWLKHPPSSFINFMTAALRDEVAQAELAMRDALKDKRHDPTKLLIDTFEDVLRASIKMNQILTMGKAYQNALNSTLPDQNACEQ